MIYKDFLKERDFLMVKERARRLPKGADLLSVQYSNMTFVFRVKSGTTPGKTWVQHIKIKNFKENDFADVDFNTAVRMLRNAELQVYCNCPAFLYWGFQYMAWHRGYGLKPENRKPKVRNPHQEGSSCKHIHLIMQIYPFLATKLASMLINKKEVKTDINIDRYRKR